MRSITDKGQSKISKHSPQGINLTACSYDWVVIVTEWGYADLREMTVDRSFRLTGDRSAVRLDDCVVPSK
jgi:acyl-CoA hydrolase